MYENFVDNLISYSQVDSNLRRTADRGLLSVLYRHQLTKLALKYFGVDENGNYTDKIEEIVSYKCPYSGELINDTSLVHLDHILPVASNGGTVIFNCIPVSENANRLKKDKHLLEWLHNTNVYFDYERLDRLVNYMLEAYKLYTEEPIDDEQFDFDNTINENILEENDDLTTSKLAKHNKNEYNNITYYQLLSDLISELSIYKEVSEYKDRLSDLQNQNIFNDINEIEKIIKIVQKNIINIIGEDNKLYLSYSLKIDMNRLLNSLSNNNYEIEINNRFNYIISIINENNLSISDYFESIEEFGYANLIYLDIDSISETQKNEFINYIKLSYDTKLLIFTNMIKHAKTPEEISNLFKARSKEKFTTYKKDSNGEWIVDKEYGELGYFYNSNKSKIYPIIEEMIKTDEKFKTKMDEYYFNTHSGQQFSEGKERRIAAFIDMIKYAKTPEEISNLLMNQSKEKFKMYKQDEKGEWIVDKTYGELGDFYRSNKSKIVLIIEEMAKTDEKFKTKMDEYYFNTYSGQQSSEGKERRIAAFIDMIKHAKTPEEISNLLMNQSKEKFKMYKQDEKGEWIVDKTYGELGNFYSSNKSKIDPIIEEMIKTDEELKMKLDAYYFNIEGGKKSSEGKERRIAAFIDMIKYAKTPEEISNLLMNQSKEKFTTYKKDSNGEWIVDKEYGELGYFYSSNKSKIDPIIEEMTKTDEKFKTKMDEYYFNTKSGQLSPEGIERRRVVFIDMIMCAKTDEEVLGMLKQRTSNRFTTYKKDGNGELIKDKEYNELGHYWHQNGIKKIIPSLYFSKEYEGVEYDIARTRVLKHLNNLRIRKKEPTFNNIDEYILTLDATKEEIKQLLEVRNQYYAERNSLIEENEQLKQEQSSVRRAM